MDLPINDRDLDTIVKALALGGDARLYHLLKDFRKDEVTEVPTIEKPLEKVQVYAESDDYQCKYGECDI